MSVAVEGCRALVGGSKVTVVNCLSDAVDGSRVRVVNCFSDAVEGSKVGTGNSVAFEGLF